MAHQVSVPAAKLNDLSLIPGTHIVEGENQHQQVVLCHMWDDT